MNLGPWEIVLIIVISVILFGAKRIPDIARALGRSLGEFKKGREEGETPEHSDQPGAAESDRQGKKE
jgi:sec-independent protein translocase protein TatA